ncbi:YadA C-terminal domain-containing protein [Vibrio tubiashii]|nr:YadA C-terminal domain-containing protein [Vibrio tubiashii]
MKKSILALAIATVSTGAFATMGENVLSLDEITAANIAAKVTNVDSVAGTATLTHDGVAYTVSKDADGVIKFDNAGTTYTLTEDNGNYTLVHPTDDAQNVEVPKADIDAAAKTYAANKVSDYYTQGDFHKLRPVEQEVVKAYMATKTLDASERTAVKNHLATVFADNALKAEFLEKNLDAIVEYSKGKDLRDFDSGLVATIDDKVRKVMTNGTDEEKAAIQQVIREKFSAVVQNKEYRNSRGVIDGDASKFQSHEVKAIIQGKLNKADKNIDIAASRGASNVQITTGGTGINNINGEEVYNVQYTDTATGETKVVSMTGAEFEQAFKTALQDKAAPTTPTPQPKTPEDKEKDLKDAAKKLVETAELTKEELAVYATTQQTAYATQESRIAQNEQDIFFLKDEVKRLDEKMDGVMAGVHAVNNARPYLMAEGDTAIGAGVGYAGSAGAVAFGAAHAFTDSLSASMTLNVTTGSYSEVSGGAGVQYKF